MSATCFDCGVELLPDEADDPLERCRGCADCEECGAELGALETWICDLCDAAWRDRAHGGA